MNTWYGQDSDKTLADNEVHIWLNYLNLHQAKLKHLYPLLSDAEKARSEQFKFFKHRKNFIASHGFLHAVLAYYLDTPAEDIEFTHKDNGKPYLLDEQNPQQLQFNMSHSGNMAILAICRNQSIGIDIEHMERKADWQGISKRFFTANEQQALYKLPEEQQKDAFYQVWTRKEAHMKVTGEGLRLPPTHFEVSVPPTDAAFIANIKSADNNFYKMQDISLPDMYQDYHACLSANFDFSRLTYYIYA